MQFCFALLSVSARSRLLCCIFMTETRFALSMKSDAIVDFLCFPLHRDPIAGIAQCWAITKFQGNG